MPSDYATIRDSIVSAIVGVAGATVPVFGYQRYSPDVQTFIEFFKTTGVTPTLHGWMVTMPPARPMGQSLGGAFNGGVMGGIARDYLFMCKGYMALDDHALSEQAFLAEVEAIIQKLDTEKNYGDTSVISYDTEAWLETFDVRQFGTPVCHHAEVRVKATVQRAVTFA